MSPSTADRAGGTRESVDASSFDLEGDGDAAALCLHGLTGTPYEVRPLAEAVAARGIRALGPTLPGHGETPEALSRIPYTGWLDAARTDLNRLRSEHARVFLVGLSLGGLLSLALAAEEPVDGIVVVGTPLALSWPLSLLVAVARFVRPFPPKRRGSDICDTRAHRVHPGYDVMPLASVREMQRLQRRVRRRLRRVTAPILVAHGELDTTANPADAHAILAGVESTQRKLLLLPRSGHVVPVDRDGPELVAEAADFLVQWA